MEEVEVFSLHSSSTTEYLFAFNVLFSYLSYSTVFVEAFMLPFQAMVMPRSWGPNWLYIFVLFAFQLEYYLWPLEISEYLFRADTDKVRILTHNDQLDEWKSRSKFWGGVFSGLTFVLASIFGTLTDEAIGFVSKPWVYVGAFGSYSMQNWLFLWYLSSVEEEPNYIAFKEYS